MNIKIITASQSNELYEHSKSFYNELEFEKICVKGFANFSFFDYVLRDNKFSDCDWVIFLDEDCFITNINAMLDLLNYQIDNNIHCSGVPDGGVISHRFHNPLSINPFFSIMNVGEIRKKYNSNLNNVYSMHYDHDLDKYIPHELINVERPHYEKFKRTVNPDYKPYGVIYNDVEKYYKLYFWLLRNEYKILYLDGYDYENDDFTTVAKNHNGVDFAYHTWFARDWQVSTNKNRILKIIDYCNSIKKEHKNDEK